MRSSGRGYMFNQMVEQLNATFTALADPTRRDILSRLALAELTVGDLASSYAMSLNAVSKHLKVLEKRRISSGAGSKDAPITSACMPSRWRLPRSGSRCTASSGRAASTHSRCSWPVSRKRPRAREPREEGPAKMSHEIRIKRSFAASAQDVYDAWTDPESLARWMLPMPRCQTQIEADVRVGGRFRDRDGGRRDHVST